MLNLFPIMFLSPFAYALLRITLGGTFLYLGYRHLTKDRFAVWEAIHLYRPRLATFSAWSLGMAELLIGGSLVAGAYTQIAALAAATLSLTLLVVRKRLACPAIPQPLFYLLTLAISCSLFITGAGAFAFDLPI